MRALFLVNARSGRRRKLDVTPLIRASAFRSSEIVPCRSKDQLTEVIARAEQDGIEVVFAVGGDGTVHETAKRLIGKPVALGIIPTGSGNGFARHVGIPMRPQEALGACAAGGVITIDTAEVAGRPFLGVMGLGFDAAVAVRFDASPVRGMVTYLREGLAAYTAFRAETYDVRLGDRTIQTDAAVVAVANSAHYGNGARIAPNASLTDGLLDIVILREMPLRRIPSLLTALWRGTIEKAPEVSVYQGEQVTIVRRDEGPAHLDGEPLTLPSHLDVAIRKQSLRLLVPDPSARL